MNKLNPKQKIKVAKEGPYLVSGNIPLQKEIIKSDEAGNSINWTKGEELPKKEVCGLCRCGESKAKPYCDGTHAKINFDGTETAPLEGFDGRAEVTQGPEISLQDDRTLCAGLRFCHNQKGRVWDLTQESGDSENKKEAINQACKCLSGRLAISGKDGSKIEPEFAPTIGITEDPVACVSGPLAVKGGIPIESAEGKIYETRNRVTLCRCGKSKNKPFCDASHVGAKFNDGDKSLTDNTPKP
jgi:CDGSH-type Zn-finger protein